MTFCALATPFIVLAVTGIPSLLIPGTPAYYKREGAILALEHLREWAKWMTGIESGAFGALATLLIIGKDETLRALSTCGKLFGWTAFVLLGSALIVSAWIFAGLSSIALRIYKIPAEAQTKATSDSCKQFDVFHQTIFGGSRSPRLGAIATWHHWLWALGLLSLGGLALSLFW